MNRGERAIQFIERLRLPEGGRFVLQPWQRDYIRKLFGTLTPEGIRQFKNSLLMMPKKNGKSTLLAAIAIYCLFTEGPSSEIYSAANSRDQASIVFNKAAAMIRSDRYLYSLVKILDGRKTITFPRRGSFYRALSADAGDKNGLNPSVVIYDELCDAPDSDLYDILETGQAQRAEPLMLVITTAGWDRQSVLWRIYIRAKKVIDGTIEDPTFFPVIYEAQKNDDWEDPATWEKANPNFGITVRPEHIEKLVREAKDSPATLNRLLRYHLNIWTETDARWIPRDKWESCPTEIPELKGRPCWIGVDLSSTIDITALVMVFPLDGGRWALLGRFYVPKESARQREKRDRVPYLSWIQQGHLIATDGDVVDYERIRLDLAELRTQYDVREVAIDRWNSTQLSTQLQGDGFTVVPYGQGYASMAAPAREFEKSIVAGRVLHEGNPVMNWMISNVVADVDAAGNVKPSKARSQEKIDGVPAALMGMGRAMVAGPPEEQYVGSLAI